MLIKNIKEETSLLRLVLSGIYWASGWLAALFMVFLLLAVLASIVSRQMAINIPGVDAYAGYFMAATGFLALAVTFKSNEHIRVTLIINSCKPAMRKILEVFSLMIGIVVSGLLAFYCTRLALISYELNDVSSGNDEVALWIPQIALAIGSIVLLISLIDEFFLEISGKRIEIVNAEGARNE